MKNLGQGDYILTKEGLNLINQINKSNTVYGHNRLKQIKISPLSLRFFSVLKYIVDQNNGNIFGGDVKTYVYQKLFITQNQLINNFKNKKDIDKHINKWLEENWIIKI